MNSFNPMYRGNPFAPQGGLLGGAMQPQQQMGLFSGLKSGSRKDQEYAQMAAPYTQWAAQQLQAVAPQTPVPEMMQFQPMQQQALAQMWNDMYRRNNNNNNSGFNEGA